MATERKVEFKFDERSRHSLEELKEQGQKFKEITIKNSETGEVKTLYIPIYDS